MFPIFASKPASAGAVFSWARRGAASESAAFLRSVGEGTAAADPRSGNGACAGTAAGMGAATACWGGGRVGGAGRRGAGAAAQNPPATHAKEKRHRRERERLCSRPSFARSRFELSHFSFLLPWAPFFAT